MDMSIWTNTTKIDLTEVFGSSPTNAQLYPAAFGKWLYNIAPKIPYLNTFFTIDNKPYIVNSLYYGTIIRPKYGVLMRQTLSPFMAGSTLDNWRGEFLNTSNNTYFYIDYALLGGCHVYGFRNYESDNYANGNTRIIVYAPAKTFNNVGGDYIIISYSPTNHYSSNYVAACIMSTKTNNIKNYGNFDNNESVRGAQRGYMYENWLNPNKGKCDTYIFNRFANDGLLANNVYTIDGGMNDLTDLTKMQISSTNYFIINKHFAIAL